MFATPPRFDLWVAAHLAMFYGRSQMFDLGIQQGIAYGVFGGVGYAGMLFVLWIQGCQPEQRQVRRRVLTIAIGSFVAIAVSILAAYAVLWPPPSAHPELARLYPEDFPVNLNATSFPSDSTALFAVLAAGIYSLRRTLGVCAWIGVGMLVALPRMFLGGHYLTDIFAGVVVGLGVYSVSILGEKNVISWGEAAFKYGWDRWQRTLAEFVVFLWILEVATNFRHAVWVVNAMFGRM